MSPATGQAVPLLLLIEGNAPDGQTAHDLLSSAQGVLRCEHVLTVDEGLARLARLDGHSAVLLDLSLPESRDLSAVDKLLGAAPKVAILVLARAADQALARRALDRGATDFVVTDHLDALTLVQLIAMMFERRAVEGQRFVERERAEVTLNSIGEAVLTTDTLGHVTYLNAEAEWLTGWSRSAAFARPLAEVFDVKDAQTGQHAQDPAKLAIEQQKKVRLKGRYILVSRDGAETTLELSAAPLCDRLGNMLGAVIVFRDVVASRQRSLKMVHLAEHDALTDLPNRPLFNDRLSRAIALGRRHERRLAVLFLNCDRLKHINDTLGHAAGDQVLKSIASRVQKAVRSSDTVSRHGGNEFIILLSEVDHAEAAGLIAQKIVASVGEPHAVAGHELLLTASIGISLYPEDGPDAETLIARADAAMHQAQSSGRNQVAFYHSDVVGTTE